MKKHTFGLENSRDFYNLFVEAFDEYMKDTLNKAKAVSCCMYGYHLIDWLKEEGVTRKVLTDNCPELIILGNIINGTKHSGLDSKRGTPAIKDATFMEAEFSDEFDSNDFLSKDALVVVAEGSHGLDKITYFTEELKEVKKYWDNYFTTIYPL
jgi:hypothetical protein